MPAGMVAQFFNTRKDLITPCFELGVKSQGYPCWMGSLSSLWHGRAAVYNFPTVLPEIFNETNNHWLTSCALSVAGLFRRR